MAMSNCEKCLENNWSFEEDDGLVIATCNMCEHEVTFEGRNMKKRTGKEIGDTCPNCLKSDLVLRKTQKHKKNKAYHYSFYVYCYKCFAIYYKEKYKTLTKEI